MGANCEPNSTECLTVQEVASRLRCRPDKVYDWINRGQLLGTNLSNGKRPTWRIEEPDLDAFLARRKNTPAEPEPTKTLRRSRGPVRVTQYV
ncbi:MAG: helix-turn-helix domain-containing protein [Planctomycetota bacterium]